jgi:anti-sigma B factor antagonist
MPLDVDVRDDQPPTVVSVGGDLDLGTAPELFDTLTGLIDAGRRSIVVDLAGVDFCDSSGLGVLVRVRNRLTQLHGAVVVARPTETVQRVLEVSGLVEAFGAYPSVEAARVALRPDSPPAD